MQKCENTCICSLVQSLHVKVVNRSTEACSRQKKYHPSTWGLLPLEKNMILARVTLVICTRIMFFFQRSKPLWFILVDFLELRAHVFKTFQLTAILVQINIVKIEILKFHRKNKDARRCGGDEPAYFSLRPCEFAPIKSAQSCFLYVLFGSAPTKSANSCYQKIAATF